MIASAVQYAGKRSRALVQALPGPFRLLLLVLPCLCARHGMDPNRMSISQLTTWRRECENNIRLLKQGLDCGLKETRVDKSNKKADAELAIAQEEENIRTINEGIQRRISEHKGARRC